MSFLCNPKILRERKTVLSLNSKTKKKLYPYAKLFGLDALTKWQLGWYLNEIIGYQKQKNLRDIARKDRNYLLYCLAKMQNFKCSICELGCGVFELIDGLKAITKLAEKKSNLKEVRYIGIETNKILAVGAKRLHENEDVRVINSIKKCPKIDILYDRAVSSYAFTKVSQLVALLRKSKVGILNLFLSKRKTFIKLNKLGKKVTYFSQKELMKKANNCIHFLYGRQTKNEIEGIYFYGSSTEKNKFLREIYKKRSIKRFFIQKQEEHLQ